jgi:hypothetical protein
VTSHEIDTRAANCLIDRLEGAVTICADCKWAKPMGDRNHWLCAARPAQRDLVDGSDHFFLCVAVNDGKCQLFSAKST